MVSFSDNATTRSSHASQEDTQESEFNFQHSISSCNKYLDMSDDDFRGHFNRLSD